MFRTDFHADPIILDMMRRSLGTTPVPKSDLPPPLKPTQTMVAHHPKRYECHISIDPVVGVPLEVASRFAEEAGFEAVFIQTQFNSVITGQSVSTESYNGLVQRARGLARKLYDILGIKTYRIKIAEILLDERYGGVVK